MTLVLYARNSDPQGFWRVFVPQFLAGLADVGIAAAIGIPAAFAVNHFWSRYQQVETLATRRADAVRALQNVRNEVLAIATRATDVPRQLISAGSTVGVQPLQATVSARLPTAAFEALQKGDHLHQVSEHTLNTALNMLYYDVNTANSFIERWGSLASQFASRPDVQEAMGSLVVVLSTYTDAAQRKATALLQQIDVTVAELNK